MKTIINTIITVLVFSLTGIVTQAKDTTKITKTTEIVVKGNCDACKNRIENAALIKGVKSATWNKKTKKLKLIYRADKVKIEAIHKAVAAAGHDTVLEKAPDKIYKKLPKCCAYRDHAHTH